MLLYDLAFDVYPADDPAGKVSGTGVAARIVRLTLDDQLEDGEYLPELFGTGSGFLVIHADHPDADLLEKRSYVKVVRMTGSLWMAEEDIGGFWLERGFLKVLSGSEQKGRIIRWEGDGASKALDRYVLGHTVYASGQTLRGDRTIPGKWAWNDEPHGAMLVRVLEEGFDHPDGFYEFLDWDFTRNLDSNGNEWEALSDYETPIGTSGLKLWADFLRLGLVAEVGPDLTVHAYRDLDEYRTDRHSATFASNKVRFQAGVNIAADLQKRINPSNQRTHVLYEDRIGDYETIDEDEDLNPIDGPPYMTYRKSTTTADDDAIRRMGRHYLSVLDRKVDIAKVRHKVGPGGIAGDEGYLPSPTGDYWLGDLVTLHTGTTEYDFNEATIEVAAIRYYVQGNQWMVETELGAQYRDIQQEQVQGQIAQTVINQLNQILLCEPRQVVEAGGTFVGPISETKEGIEDFVTINASSFPSAAQPGDWAVIDVADDGDHAIPGIPAPWTAIGAGGLQSPALGRRGAYVQLTDDILSDAVGVDFSQADSIVGGVWRNLLESDPIGAIAGSNANNTSAGVPALTLEVTDGSSIVFCGISHHSDASISGKTITAATALAGARGGEHGTWRTPAGVASWSASTPGGTSNSWQGFAYELKTGGETVLNPDAALAELTGTSRAVKRCDDTEHWHAEGSDSPTATDDQDAGFRPGTIWVNDDGEAWIAFDVTPGAADWIQLVGAGGVDLSGINFLVGTATGLLSGEIVAGTSPGGELGGTWASPTVDATHSGSTHSAAADAHIADTSAAHVASAIGFTPNGSIAATDVQAAIQEVRDEAAGGGAPSTADYLVGTADAGLSGEIVVGTSPGGELGGTWASPTVDATHSGSAHHAEDHDHDGSPTQKLAGANTHQSPDTDSAAGSLHHTIGSGATQAAAGNHSHAGGSGGSTVIEGRYTHSATQTIATATDTAVLFDTETDDPGGMHSTASLTSRITVQAAQADKIIRIHAAINVEANTSQWQCWIRRNGAGIVGGVKYRHNGNNTGISAMQIDVSILAADHVATDYYEIIVRQATGANRAIGGAGDASNWVEVLSY